MAGRRLGEHIHRKAFILRTVFVHHPLRHAYHLKLRHAGLDLLDHLLAGKFRDAIAFPQAVDFIYALDGAQFNHNLVRTDDLRLRKRVAYALHDHNGGIQIARNSDAQLLSRDANRLEDIVIGVRLQLGICGVCAFPVFF